MASTFALICRANTGAVPSVPIATNDRIAIYNSRRNEVTLIGLIQHVDPGAGLSRPLCKLFVSRLVVFRGRVDQPHALEISRRATPRLKRELSA